jgi:hypothetical protein
LLQRLLSLLIKVLIFNECVILPYFGRRVLLELQIEWLGWGTRWLYKLIIINKRTILSPSLHVKTCLTCWAVEGFIKVKCTHVGRAHLSGHDSRVFSRFLVLSYGHRTDCVLRNVCPHRPVLIFVVGIAVRVARSLSTGVSHGIRNDEWCFLGATVYWIRSILDCLPLRGNQKFAFFAFVFATFWSSTFSWRETFLPLKIFLLSVFLSFSQTHVGFRFAFRNCLVRTTSFLLGLKFAIYVGSQLLSVLRMGLRPILLRSDQSRLLSFWPIQIIFGQTQFFAIVFGVYW